MSRIKELPVRTTGTGDDQVYFLRSGDASADTEITKTQYDAIIEFGETGREGGGTLSDADILRLHQESDPASPFYKGEPVDNSAETPTVHTGFYDLNQENLDSAQKIDQQDKELTVQSTEQVTTGKKPKAETKDEGNA